MLVVVDGMGGYQHILNKIGTGTKLYRRYSSVVYTECVCQKVPKNETQVRSVFLQDVDVASF